MKTYRELIVWQKAMNLVVEIYLTTKEFPREELYSLTSQIRRCSISIPSNIAEGFGRKSTSEYYRFLEISLGSIFELQTQLEISLNLQYMKKIDFEKMYQYSREIERMLCSLMNKLKKSN